MVVLRGVADTCKHSAHGVKRVENFDVLYGGVVGDEVEGEGVRDGVGIAAGL